MRLDFERLDQLLPSGIAGWARPSLNVAVMLLAAWIALIAMRRGNVRREYLRRLKSAFDSRGVEIPYPHLTICPGADKAGSAPPLRVARAASEARRG